MRLQDRIPKSWRLQYQLRKRQRQDKKKGILSKLAQSSTNPNDIIDYQQVTAITQPIKRSYLFENKIHNLQLGYMNIRKVLIQPQQIFSFWHILGEPNAKNGYKIGRNLVNGVLTEGYGGGLCQLASILYHTALVSGLPIVERYNHSLDIYEESNRFTPLGADATVVYGYKDLRLENPFQAPIQFRFEITTEIITCQLWSPKPLKAEKLTFERHITGKNIKVITRNTIGESIAVSTYIKL